MKIKAFHLDLKAGCFRREYLPGFFRRITGLGYTHLVVEIEDKVRLDGIAGAWWHESYSKEEFSGLLAEASEAGLVPVPLIQTLGHLEFLLTRARYHHLRESSADDRMLCPSLDESRVFLKRLIAEVYELFGAPPFMHLGADEARSMGVCRLCRQYSGSEGMAELFSRHVNELAAEVLARGSRPVIWADMALTYPEAVGLLNKDIILVDWDYNTGDGVPERVRIWGKGYFSREEKDMFPPGFMSGPGRFVFMPDGTLRPWPYTKHLIESGFDVWVAPAATSGGDHYFTPRYMHLQNITGSMNRLNSAPSPGGIMVTSWALRLTTLESQMPGIAIQKAAGDSDAREWKDLEPEVSRTVFGKELPGIFRAWEKISVPLLNTHSYLGVDKYTYYYGPAECIDCLMDGWDRDGSLKLEADSLGEKIEGYSEGEKITAALLPGAKPGLDTVSFLNFAARAMQVKAAELNMALSSRYGKGKKDKSAASSMLIQTEALRDEYAEMLGKLYFPASVERFLAIIFDSSRRYLARTANKT